MKKTSHQKSIIAGNMTTTKGGYYLRSHAKAKAEKHKCMFILCKHGIQYHKGSKRLRNKTLVKHPPPVRTVIEYPTEYTYWQTPRTYYEI